MKSYCHTDAPLKVFGVPFFEQTGELRRFPETLLQEIESIRPLAETHPAHGCASEPMPPKLRCGWC